MGMRGCKVDAILTFANVTKAFGSFQALKNISFQLKKNKITGLIGANGSGKTTTMRLIIRLLSPDSGSIYLKGSPIETFKNEIFPISYIPDVPVYYEELTVSEHLTLISSMYNTQSEKTSLVERLELSGSLNKVPSILSKGTKQKLSIACALLRNFDLLLADEPFSGLDPKQIKVLKDIFIENKNRGKMVIVSTHLLDMVESLCDEYIMLDNGEILARGTFDEIVSNNSKCTTLEDLYMHLATHKMPDGE